MNEHDTSDPRSLLTEPEDLNGHTIEQLSDYLEAGRSPADPSIEQSPGCRIALDALIRLRELTPELLAADTAAEPDPDENWVQSILAGIVLDARAGRRIPLAGAVPNLDAPVANLAGPVANLAAPVPKADLGITEGAVRGLIRAAEKAVPGAIIGKCRFDGDVTVLGEPVRVCVDVSVPYGEPIPDLADRLRNEIRARLMTHTTLNVTGIDITVQDIQPVVRPTKDDR